MVKIQRIRGDYRIGQKDYCIWDEGLRYMNLLSDDSCAFANSRRTDSVMNRFEGKGKKPVTIAQQSDRNETFVHP
jgi:hypothetical protein